MDFNTVTFKIKNNRKAKLPIDLVTRYNNHVGELRDKDLDHLMIVCEIPSDADDNTIRNELITALEEEIATNMALPEMVEHMRDIMIKKQEINDYRQITYGKNIYSYMFQNDGKKPDHRSTIYHRKKEALTNTGAVHQTTNGSLLDGGASFVIGIPAFVADFKRNESVIIKNMPDGLLNENTASQEDDYMTLNERILGATIESEQSKYKCKITVDEARKLQKEADKKANRQPPTSTEINQYISEVRNGL